MTRPGTPVRRGWFITIEGPDGAGKTTQAQRLAAHLRPAGHDVHLTREPGGTWLGERLRELLLARTASTARTDPLTDALLFNAARRQLVTEVIVPALEAGQTVVCARYADSTLAYQGYGAGVPLEDLRTLAAAATGGLTPGPDDPPGPAGRGRARAQGTRGRDPVRGGVRPRLPPSRARGLPRPGRGDRRAGSRSSTPPDRPTRSRRRRRSPLTGCSARVNRNPACNAQPHERRSRAAADSEPPRPSTRRTEPCSPGSPNGELDALEELYDRYKTMAYSIAYRITNDVTLAEDVVQDAFLGAWRNAARYLEGRGQREDLAALDRPSPSHRRHPSPPPDHRAARARRGPAGVVRRSPMSGPRSPRASMPTPCGAPSPPCPTCSVKPSSSPTSAV